MSANELKQRPLLELLRRKAREVAAEPEHNWGGDFQSYMSEGKGQPAVRLAVTNFKPQLDIWQGLRSPSHVGMYPLTPADIWKHWAAANVKNTRSDGSPNPLAMPESFEEALGHLKRVLIISAMLPVDPQVFEAYAAKIERGDEDPLDYYCRAMKETETIIDKAVGKLGLMLISPGRAVVPMTNKNSGTIIDRTRADYLQGTYHGPCNSHWPQGSIAVMTGLMQFGVHRMPFRDEAGPKGKGRRLMGRYTSIVVFDEQPPTEEGGLDILDKARLNRLHRSSDFTNVDDEVVAGRFCTYNLTAKGDSVCGKCVEVCPSGAMTNSSPGPDGKFAERIKRQKHRFFKGTLDFDAGNCSRHKNQRKQLYPEFMCAYCEAVCTARGVIKSAKELKKIS